MNTAVAVAASVPTSMLVMASVAGATAQVTGADREAVKRAMLYFGGAMILAALLTQNLAVAVATTGTVVAVNYGLHHAWGTL